MSGIVDTVRMYRVRKNDLPKLEELLTECFSEDPLYQTLIPDETLRNRLLPELMKCDLTEFYNKCEIFADSKELRSVIVIMDKSEHRSLFEYYFETIWSLLKTDSYLIKEDHTLKTLHNFIVGKNYLNSRWTSKLKGDKRLHIEYLAVRPNVQHHGISSKLLNIVTDYADRHQLDISLETHNSANLPLYEHHGFEIFEVDNDFLGLKQYCMVRKSKGQETKTECELKVSNI